MSDGSDSDYLAENGYSFLVDGNIPKGWGEGVSQKSPSITHEKVIFDENDYSSQEIHLEASLEEPQLCFSFSTAAMLGKHYAATIKLTQITHGNEIWIDAWIVSPSKKYNQKS
ncbi:MULTISPECIES: hypothetical protein [unclassified Vibrio]|uniref:hypothetical protein n=1 Tax=unclassified Vibrio TaxID=2614977 RepID=UPI003553AF66